MNPETRKRTFAEVESYNHELGECFLDCRLCKEAQLKAEHQRHHLASVLRWPKVNQPEDKPDDL